MGLAIIGKVLTRGASTVVVVLLVSATAPAQVTPNTDLPKMAVLPATVTITGGLAFTGSYDEFVAKLFASAARWSVLPVPRACLQTVAVAETGQAIVDICERPPCLGRVNIAGPEICTARDLALAWKAFSGRHAMLIEIPLPGKLGRALREGALTTDRPDIRGKLGFRDWLAAQPGSGFLP